MTANLKQYDCDLQICYREVTTLTCHHLEIYRFVPVSMALKSASSCHWHLVNGIEISSLLDVCSRRLIIAFVLQAS